MNGVTSDTKEDFCRHLCRLGFEIGAGREWVIQKFRRHLGEERFAAFNRLASGPRGGTHDDPLYDFVQDFAEANLLRSVDPDVTVDTSYFLYQMARPFLKKGARVLELACWTGGLSSFIAASRSGCDVIGVDRVQRLIALNRGYHQLRNLSFQLWNYRDSKPPQIEPADLLLCGLGINNLPDGGYDGGREIRASDGYRQHKADALIYFNNWRSAARPGAMLLAVLRVNTFGRFVAYLDAAREGGWMPDLPRCTTVLIPAAQQIIPAFQFVARESNPYSEHELLRHFVRLATPNSPYAQFVDGLALAVYHELKDRKPLQVTSIRAANGQPFHEEIGTAGPVGYAFGYDSTPRYRLALISAAEAEMRAAQLQQGGISLLSQPAFCSATPAQWMTSAN